MLKSVIDVHRAFGKKKNVAPSPKYHHLLINTYYDIFLLHQNNSNLFTYRYYNDAKHKY